MKLDLNNRTIEYFVNHKSHGIAFKNVLKSDSIKYRFVISIYDSGDIVTLIEP